MEKKIGFLIPIRLDSERLPGKALQELGGKTVLETLIERVKLSKYYREDNVVICTTNEPGDDKLAAFCKEKGYGVFRGSTDDIIDRFYEACKHYAFDAVIQIDGDDPCTDPQYMDVCMDELLKDDQLGIVKVEGLPLGIASKAFSYPALEKVWQAKQDDKNDTGFIYYFLKTDLVKKKILEDVPEEHKHDTARLTLDYQADLEFFRELLNIAEADGQIALVGRLVEVLQERPELLKINTHLSEEYWERTAELSKLYYRDQGGNVREIDQ